MNSAREEQLFRLVLAQPAGGRRAWLDRECADDPELRQRLDTRLTAQESADTETRVEAHTDADHSSLPQGPSIEPPDEAVGQSLGRYRLLEKIGEGGCGVVYVAEQTEPVQRRVALKVIKLGMDTKAVVARFEAERQALALMDHPNIARVLDAGATELGRPYFVMELVRGTRITDYCDTAELNTQDRLLLFIKVCQAIQHAHQKGIIHRDIKPSNILVTMHDGVPVPKVIDFGIAKATEGRLTENTVYTQLHQFIGTPAYMSPEQAEMSGLDIDTRSDIYSLGVLLYELLAGSTPFDPRELLESGLDAMRRTIREQEPVRPSTRLSDLPGDQLTNTARRRSEDAPHLVRQLRGDLDWIVMKCLEKDRTRRYDSAADLAADLSRFLANEPVVARPPTTLYRFQKAFRRHKLVFSAALGVVAALIVGLTASLWQADRAKRAYVAAETARQNESAARAQAEAASERAATNELQARRTAYSSDMNLAQQALAASNVGRAQSLLDRQRPQPGQTDLRDWEWRYLWSQTRADPHETLLTHTNGLSRVMFSPDGRLVALTEPNGELILLDLLSRQPVLRQSGVWKVAFAHRSPWLAFISDSRSASNAAIVLWDTLRRTEIRRLPIAGLVGRGHLAFLPDDSQLLAATDRPNPSIINSPEAQPIELLLTSYALPSGQVTWQRPLPEPETSQGRTFAVSPTGERAVAALPGGRFQVFDTRTGEDRLTVKATVERVTALAFSPDGKQVLSGAGYTDPTIHVWDAEKGTPEGTLEGHRSWVSDLVFSSDGTRLASASADQTVRLWEWSTRQSTGLLRGHLNAVMGITFFPDNRTVASHGKESIFLWDVTKPSRHLGYRLAPVKWLPDSGTTFTPDSRYILGVEPGGGVAFWDVSTLQEARRLWKDSDQSVLAVAPDARSVVRSDANGRWILWDTEPVREQRVLDLPSGTAGAFFTENGRYLVAVQDKGTQLVALILDRATGRPLGEIPVQRERAMWIGATSRSNSLVELAVGGIRVYDVSQPSAAPRQVAESGDYFGLEVAPDGRTMAVPYGTGQIWLWDLETGAPVDTLKGFLLGAHSVTFSPDGRRLAAGSNGTEAVKLWDTATRQEVLTLAGEGSLFKFLKFSPDGRYLLAINGDGVAHLWEAPTWAEITASDAKR
ncbi:MAG: protein kinase [Verrucomicrobia bacterium]|nr:protein kinase [Verrucomicrobiota bacterium]